MRRRLRIFAAAMAAVFLAAVPAGAQSVTGTFGDPKSDKSQDIHIEADVLEIEQKKQQATFTGRVDATRGTLRLRSNTLVAEYREVKQGASTKTEITKLDARGNVIVTSKDKKAVSEWAIMLPQTGKVTMGGNVVLTQGETVIEGETLEMDLNTGKSRVIGSKARNGRVKGVFVPSRK
jgi:lipopolysaccharide export system protein LptA